MTGTRTLDVYELAYLAAGPRRAAEAAVVALIEAGVLRANHTTGDLILLQRRPCSELEAAVLDAVGSRRHRLLGTVCWRLRADVRLTGIGQRLQNEGLLARGGAPESLRRRWWTALAVTGAGRRALRRRRRELGADAPDALRVALSGPAAMRDRGLYVALFDPPRLLPASQLRRATPAALAAGGYHHGGAIHLAGGAFGGGGGGDGC
jgi:hypothetical protein